MHQTETTYKINDAEEKEKEGKDCRPSNDGIEINLGSECDSKIFCRRLVTVGSVSHEVQAKSLWCMINGIYFCLGGFCSIFNLLKTEKREDSTLISSVLNRIGNKWIEIVEAFISR